MTSRKINQSRKLSFQQLEDRQLMAGNVTAAVSNHSLTITGDNDADQIQIVQVANQTNQFTVAGFNATTINGKASQTFTITGNISVNFKGYFSDLVVGNLLTEVPTASANTTLPGSLNVVLGNGYGWMELFNTSVGGNVTISGGSGEDHVNFSGSNIGLANVNGGNHDCSINLGGGLNVFQMKYTTVERDLLFHDNGSTSNDEVQLFGGSVGRNATIQTGVNNDSVEISEYYFGKALNVQTGGGADFVALGETYNDGGNGVPTSKASINADTVFADLGTETTHCV